MQSFFSIFEEVTAIFTQAGTGFRVKDHTSDSKRTEKNETLYAIKRARTVTQNAVHISAHLTLINRTKIFFHNKVRS